MLFTSISFLIFFIVVYAIYWFLNFSLKAQNAFLLISSLFFYSFWSARFTLLMLALIIVTYILGNLISKQSEYRRHLLIFSIFLTVSLIISFKYLGFIESEIINILGLFGIVKRPYLSDLIIPIGISFYTFHSMSYIFDIYRYRIKPVNSIVDYGLFISFFPLLIAGPIERAEHFLPQISNRRLLQSETTADGLRLILFGVFKKVAIADFLAIYVVDSVFNNLELNLSDPSNYAIVLSAIFGFSIQIYADFSAYSDIALGLSKLLGFELLSNFRFPYFSRDLIEFWKRWHISLTSWFRDYLYIPLGGSRTSKTSRNIFIVFLVSAIWHGANWTFIIWGLLHWLGFVVTQILRKSTHLAVEGVIVNIIKVILTFLFVTFTWLFFRSESVFESLRILQYLLCNFYQFAKHPIIEAPSLDFFIALFFSFILLAFDFLFRRDERKVLNFQKRTTRYFFYFLLVFLILFAYSDGIDQFIYFQF